MDEDGDDSGPSGQQEPSGLELTRRKIEQARTAIEGLEAAHKADPDDEKVRTILDDKKASLADLQAKACVAAGASATCSSVCVLRLFLWGCNGGWSLGKERMRV